MACNQAVAKFHNTEDINNIIGNTDNQLFPEYIAELVIYHDAQVMYSNQTNLYNEHESDRYPRVNPGF